MLQGWGGREPKPEQYMVPGGEDGWGPTYHCPWEESKEVIVTLGATVWAVGGAPMRLTRGRRSSQCGSKWANTHPAPKPFQSSVELGS